MDSVFGICGLRVRLSLLSIMLGTEMDSVLASVFGICVWILCLDCVSVECASPCSAPCVCFCVRILCKLSAPLRAEHHVGKREESQLEKQRLRGCVNQ